MKRPISKCNYCYHVEQRKKLDDIIIKKNYKTIGEYVHHKQRIEIQCLLCNDIKKIIPRNIMYMKTVGNCSKCRT